jgi:hypothetical protein
MVVIAVSNPKQLSSVVGRLIGYARRQLERAEMWLDISTDEVAAKRDSTAEFIYLSIT